MNTLYLICFVLGLVLSLLSVFTGLGRLHFGHGFHVHGGNLHAGSTHVRASAKPSTQMAAVNGFTLPAFLCWFGGAGYLLHNNTSLVMPLVLLLAAMTGLAGASILYVVLFQVLLPRERVLSREDTRMEGVLARVTDEIRAGGHIGEILYTQLSTRRSAAARSEDGSPIPRGTEVVVLRYQKGIAYVRPLPELAP
jgi:membrane protein implicated in regulation of membrane protease activity